MTTITIKFGDIFNTMLPTDYVEQSVSFKEINSDQSSLFAADEHVKQSTNCFPFYRSINKKQSWIRVGDFLNTTEIFKCIGICNKSFYKLGAIFLICCHHKYNCAKYSATANKEEEEVKDPTSGIVPILNNVAVDLSRVMKNELENRSFRGIRSDWLYWNLFVPEYDKFFLPKMQQWRQQLRAGEQSNISKQLYGYFLIMLPSQEKKDRKSEETFYRLIDGRPNPLSYLKFLQKHSFQDVFNHFKQIFDSGMNGLKALSFITFIVPYHILNNDDFNRHGGKYKYKQLQVYPQVAEKKQELH